MRVVILSDGAREKELKGWSRKKKFELISKAVGDPSPADAGSG
jgi:predicted GIY-YIG superfamily endonuclease